MSIVNSKNKLTILKKTKKGLNMREKNVVIFGGAFNPPTKGHESVIKQLIETKDVDEVWVLPSFAHAHGKKPIPFEKRVMLTQILVDKIGSEKVLVSNEEKDCFESVQKEYVYTYDLLLYLSNKYPEYDFKFACGQDNAKPENWAKFYNSKKIDDEFGKIVVSEEMDIRSTYIRDAIHSGNYKELDKYSYPEIIKEVLTDY